MDDLKRREFLKRTALAGGALFVGQHLLTDGSGSLINQTLALVPPTTAEKIAVRLRINGSNYGLRLDPRVSLLNLLREQLELTGTKKGCDHGQCGACTVIVDGKRINSCLALAVTYDGSEVTTIEGIAKGDQLHPLQTADLFGRGDVAGSRTGHSKSRDRGRPARRPSRTYRRRDTRTHVGQHLPLRRVSGYCCRSA
jgi:hypothetical protein